MSVLIEGSGGRPVFVDLTVTPTATETTYLPSSQGSDKTAFNQVVVNGDANLIAANIANQCNVFDVVGTALKSSTFQHANTSGYWRLVFDLGNLGISLSNIFALYISTNIYATSSFSSNYVNAISWQPVSGALSNAYVALSYSGVKTRAITNDIAMLNEQTPLYIGINTNNQLVVEIAATPYSTRPFFNFNNQIYYCSLVY